VRAWVAKTYLGQDEILRTDFPVDAMGKAALALAIEERERQLERMAGLARLHPAEEAIRTGMTPHLRRAAHVQALQVGDQAQHQLQRRERRALQVPNAGHPATGWPSPTPPARAA
jgi:hypothetical protein